MVSLLFSIGSPLHNKSDQTRRLVAFHNYLPVSLSNFLGSIHSSQAGKGDCSFVLCEAKTLCLTPLLYNLRASTNCCCVDSLFSRIVRNSLIFCCSSWQGRLIGIPSIRSFVMPTRSCLAPPCAPLWYMYECQAGERKYQSK